MSDDGRRVVPLPSSSVPPSPPVLPGMGPTSAALPRVAVDELVRQRRLRALGRLLDDVGDPLHKNLAALADALILDGEGSRAAARARLERR